MEQSTAVTLPDLPSGPHSVIVQRGYQERVARRRMPRPSQDKLDAAGEDEIIYRIECGMTYAEIADMFGSSEAVVIGWLRATPERSARAKAAMLSSAEAWIDRGFSAAEDPNMDPKQARIITQECARRAALRNPEYRERQEVDHKHQVELPASQTLAQAAAALALQAGLGAQVMSALGGGRTFDMQPVTQPIAQPEPLPSARSGYDIE